MVSIMILAIAIIPMVSMFDVGLKSATNSGNYDKARALANQQLEKAKSLPYITVRDSFPTSSCTPTAAAPEKTCSGLTTGVPSGITSYSVKKRFIDRTLSDSSTDQGLMKITVTVSWGASNSYKTTGVVVK